jgi:hypothetical protein
MRPIPVLNLGPQRQPMLMNSRVRAFIGQASPWGTPTTSIPLPGTTAPDAGGVDLRCYQCGMNPPRLMTPAMASMAGNCREVDASLCGEQQAAAAGETQQLSAFDGPTQIFLSVLEPTELGPYPGAHVKVSLLDFRTYQVVQANVGSGVTDAQGKFFFEGQAPNPNTMYRWRIELSGDFSSQTRDIPARTATVANKATGEPEQMYPEMVVCPPGVDSLVCAVAQAQIDFQVVYDVCTSAWTSSAQTDSFCMDQAHANIKLDHPELAANWATFTWWVGVRAIKPKQWPDLIKNLKQTSAVFNSIPFPILPGAAEDYFVRCARGIPIWKGMSVGDPFLYVSDYFPRDSRQIEVDMALQYLTNVPAIGRCIVHKLKQKSKEIERSAKAFNMMALASVVMLAPIAGTAAPSLIVTEVAQFAYSAIKDEPVTQGVDAVVTAGVGVAALDPDAWGKLIAAGITLVVDQYGDDLDPTTKQVINAILPKVVEAGVSDLVGGTTTVGTGAGSGAADFISLQGIGSAAAAVAVRFIANTIRAHGVRGVGAFQDAILGLANMDKLVVPFMVWAIKVLLLDAIFEAAAQLAEAEDAAGVPLPEGVTPVTPDGTPITDGAPVGDGVPVDDGIPVGDVVTPGVPVGDGVTPGVPEDSVSDTGGQGAPIGDLNGTTDIIDPMIEDAEAGGVEVPSEATATRQPILEATAPISTETALATAGIGAGALVLALVLGGVFK